MSAPLHYFSPSTLRICIDEMQDTVIAGRVYCKMLREPLYFSSITDMLLKVDRFFDQKGYPQAFVQKRAFDDGETLSGFGGVPELYYTDEQMLEFKGEEATIEIVVNSRRHATWQGIIRRDDGTVISDYEGEIAFIKYIQKFCG